MADKVLKTMWYLDDKIHDTKKAAISQVKAQYGKALSKFKDPTAYSNKKGLQTFSLLKKETTLKHERDKLDAALTGFKNQVAAVFSDSAPNIQHISLLTAFEADSVSAEA